MHAVILAGGLGSRLWPVSRATHPKPFMTLSDDESLLQKVYLRSMAMPSIKSLTTVTHKDLLLKAKQEYINAEKKCKVSFDCNYISEPFGKNTAAAIALATQEISSLYGEDALLLILPADHIILDDKAFHQAVIKAKILAETGHVVTFGIKPTAPETGYGYIESNGNEVIRFIEKPSLEQAEVYLKNDKFLWNAGMFCFSAKTMLQELALYCPDILTTTKKCLTLSKDNKSMNLYHRELDPESFAAVPENSIDYAIMEKTKKLAIVPCDIAWSDVGTWTAIHALKKSDANGNALTGEVITHEVKNCYIESSTRVIGAVGIENLVIVDTPDALLVANKNNVQDVKIIYNQLKNMQHDVHKWHTTVQRPWGSYSVLEEGYGFKVKRIEVDPKASLSLQMHHHRAEHWVVISGQALVKNGDKEFTLEVNQSTSIHAGTRHRLTNPGTTTLIIIEIQTGTHVSEDDIVRFDDIYGRIPLANETLQSS